MFGETSRLRDANGEDIMTIDRKTGHAPRVSALSQDLISVGPCIGCKDCRGLCPALMEMIALPEAILSRGAS